MLFTAFSQFFASFPEFQRRLEIESAMLELLHDVDQLITGFFVP